MIFHIKNTFVSLLHNFFSIFISILVLSFFIFCMLELSFKIEKKNKTEKEINQIAIDRFKINHKNDSIDIKATHSYYSSFVKKEIVK